MARIIEARVRQKAATLEEWNNSDLESLDGEQLFVRSDVDDKVIGFKLGAKGKKFSELDYPDFTVRGKVSPTSTWVDRQSGVYIPTSNGVYNGIEVNLADGYQVLYWDGETLEKVVYPVDYSGAVFGGAIDDSKDLSTPPTEPTWYIASPGDYNTTPPITLTENSILSWDGNEWSHIPFELEVRGEFLVADNIAEVRNITPEVAQLLVNGIYKGVEVLGYYEKGDTPAPIIYYLSDTTEEDDGGSVIEAGGIKLEHDFVGEVDVRYFGIFSDGIERTALINKCIEVATNRNCSVKFTGTEYLVNSRLANNRGIVIPSGTRMYTGATTYFKSTPQEGGTYAVVYSANSSNIYINRLVVKGDREEHIGTTGEWGMGLSLNTVSDVTIDYLQCDDCWGDGLYLGKVYVGDTNHNIVINNFYADNNRRQGLSVITARGLVLNNSVISNTNGASPQSGIDFEPNHPEDEISGVVINNIKTYNNSGGGIIYVSMNSNEITPNVDITINNWESENERAYSSAGARLSRVRGSIIIQNLISKNAPIMSVSMRNYVNQPDVRIINPISINPNRTGLGNDFSAAIAITRESSDSFPSDAYHPRIEIINPVVRVTSGSLRRGIQVYNFTSDPNNWIRNVSVINPDVEGTSVSKIMYQSDLRVEDPYENTTRNQTTSNYNLSYYLAHAYYTNKGSTSNIRVIIGDFKHYSSSPIKIKIESNSYFGVSFSGIARINIFPTYTNIRSNTVGSYLTIRCIDFENEVWEVVEMFGVWEMTTGHVINTIARVGATTSENGMVRQSSNVPNVLSPNLEPSVPSTAIDVPGVVADLNDLITKYNSTVNLVNEIKTQLNAKLSADRASGQQSTD